jgi:putative ABC transport system substrate-binding protein
MRRRFLASSLALAAGTMLSGHAAGRGRPYRIYMVTWRGITPVEKGFEGYLRSRGVNVEYLWRDAGQNPARIEEFVREIRGMTGAERPDLIYCWGTPPTLGIVGAFDAPDRKRFIDDIPVIFALVASPVGAKIVPSFRDQKRNVTGIFHVAALESQLEAIGAYRRFTKLGVLYNAAERNSVATAEGLRALGAKQGFSVLEQTFDRNAEGKAISTNIDAKISALKAGGADWLYLGPDSFLFTQLEHIAAAAMAERLPTFSATEGALTTKGKVLAGLVSKYSSVGAFAGFKAEQILVKGLAARDIPVETLSLYSYLVRMDVAKELDFLPPIALFNYAEFI